MLCLKDRNTCAQRIEYVYGREHIGRSVLAVNEPSGQVDEEIVSAQGVKVGAKSLTIVPKGADNKKYQHAGVQEQAESVKFTSVYKHEPGAKTEYINKPEQVWDNKYLAKRNQVIQFNMN